MRIRKMTVSDLAEVSPLATQLGYPGSLAQFQQRFSALDGHPDHALFVAEDEGGRILGWIHVDRDKPSLVADPRAEISALVVDERVRSQGIGKALLQAAEAWARAKQLELVRIRSNVKREPTHRFYLREGYSIAKSWHLFTKSFP